jgi:hypothetical protein
MTYIRYCRNPEEVFYNLLRPELLQSNSVALCSDTYSNFDKGPDPAQHIKEVEEAHHR